ncbi:hypothetical protein CBP51_03095 [Cellvibrio mixtus]|uniref:Restriction endonuclease type IV Mrr domain-containing protein n=1 Tax=Cellvibrio mixtus TaxID=39650 RepID=A0A266Q9J1_9GAMM|nr:hypothetical protein [Cellvibrio mixtus]OZY86031.1 hypothetical protein CBP51_03095 [Cellvibrio mixtus]
MIESDGGHLLELQFLETIRDGVEEIWGIKSAFCQFHNRKKYYSKDRQAFVEVDVSIEVTRPNADTWYQILVFECKDQARPVDVNSIERLKAQTDQIAGKNIKAFMVSKSGFSTRCLNYAIANGIGLINYSVTDFSFIAESREIIASLEYEPAVVVESLEGVGPYGDMRSLRHYRKNTALEFYGIFCIEASPAWYRRTGCLKEVIQCEAYEPGRLEFHVSTNEEFQ